MTNGPREMLQGRRIGIIGAGPGGICMAIKLREAGVDTFTIFDRAPAVGGTWFHNTYPGCACDVPSALYSFSFELKRDWSRPYGTQPEIQRYFEYCVDKYGLAPYLRLGEGIAAATWDDDRALWVLTTERGDEHEFDVVIAAVGMFGKPAWPMIPGFDQFEGTVFHSARWDHSHDITGERVAVVGSAASAVQFVPVIAAEVGQLVLFQRTPNWVLPKADVPYTDEDLERLRDRSRRAPRGATRVWERRRRLHHVLRPQSDRAGPGAGAAEHGRRRGRRGARAKLTPNSHMDANDHWSRTSGIPRSTVRTSSSSPTRSRASTLTASSPPTACIDPSTPSCSRPASRPRVPRDDRRHRARWAPHRGSLARRCAGVPRGHHRGLSRTSSCSTGRTPTTARSCS